MDIRSELIGLRDLQNASLGDPHVCVAVLDGPVDLSHPCFHGAALRRLDTLVQDPPGGGAMSIHGTHVTSLIFGQPDSAAPGIAPRCRGLLAPVFRDDAEGRLSQLDLVRAIEQVVQEGAQIINISGGERSPQGQADDMLERALRLCDDNNVLVIAATGNDGCACLHVPAALPSVLAVGALADNGEPLETSNWGEAYRSNGILAPGEDIKGAVPGGGTASLTGSSFATPVVSGVAALLLSIQRHNGQVVDPKAIGRALLETALPCYPSEGPECQRYLVGTLNLPGAYALITGGGRKIVAIPDVAQAPSAAEASTTRVDLGAAGMPAMGIEAPALRPSAEASAELPNVGGAGEDSPAPRGEPSRTAGPGPTPAVDVSAAQSEQPSTNGPTYDAGVTGMGPSADCGCRDVKTSGDTRLTGVVPSGGCGCNGCNGNGDKTSNVFVIANIGIDFGTEARRDSFRQLIPAPEGQPTANPYVTTQLLDYLDSNPWESTKLIWTLNLGLTPIYAVKAEVAYAEEVYRLLRSALRGQSLPTDNADYVSRVSVPGRLTKGKTVRLFSGQVVPEICAQARGLFTWNESTLVDEVLRAVQADLGTEAAPSDRVRILVRSFLDKVYFELRNLGQSPSDRALNYAATNVFAFAQAASGALLSAKVVPGDSTNLYALDYIKVSKSPYCRPDSDCWVVELVFFDPEETRRARVVLQLNVDVAHE